jgi:hypothetical protein
MDNRFNILQSIYDSIERMDTSDWLINGEPVKKVSDYDANGIFKNLISPNAKTANNLNTQIVIVLQDWANQANADKFFSNPEGSVLKYGYDPFINTNKNLRNLLVEFFSEELLLSSADKDDESLAGVFNKIYITNIFQFLKPGGMSSVVPQKFVKKCAEFTKQEIKLINPKLVICLGSKSFFGLTRSKRKYVYIDGILYFHQYHPAARVSKQQMLESWSQMKALINSVTGS